MHNLTTQSPYAELAAFLRDQKAEIGRLEAQTKALKADLEDVQKNILPAKLEADGMKNVTVEGIGRLSNNPQFRASVKAKHKMDMQNWLRENGFGDMIQATLNSSTLKAWVKEQMEEGNEIPVDYLNLDSFDLVTLTKA